MLPSSQLTATQSTCRTGGAPPAAKDGNNAVLSIVVNDALFVSLSRSRPFMQNRICGSSQVMLWLLLMACAAHDTADSALTHA
jgi:hypothetical protein